MPLKSFSLESKDEKLYQKAMSVYRDLKASPTKKGDGPKWEPLAEGFYSIYRTYPNSPRADDALFMAAKVYEQVGIKFGSKEALEKSGGDLFLKENDKKDLGKEKIPEKIFEIERRLLVKKRL